MRLPSYDRWLALGELVAGLGTTVIFGWLIYALQSNGKTSFFSWPGIVGLIVMGVGILSFTAGFFKKDKEEQPSSSNPMKRIAYNITGNGKSKTRNAHIRNQDIAFNIQDNGHLDDESSDIA